MDRAWVYAGEFVVELHAARGALLPGVGADALHVGWGHAARADDTRFVPPLKRRPGQSVRDFNVEFDRVVLRLYKVKCTLPPLIKAWLCADKPRLSEQEEVALCVSVGNEFDVKKLQHAAYMSGISGGSVARGHVKSSSSIVSRRSP